MQCNPLPWGGGRNVVQNQKQLQVGENGITNEFFSFCRSGYQRCVLEHVKSCSIGSSEQPGALVNLPLMTEHTDPNVHMCTETNDQ